MDDQKINITVSRQDTRRPIISRPAFIILLIGVIAIIAVVGISGFVALKLRIAQRATQAPAANNTPLTDEQKRQLLEQLSAPVAGSPATTMTDAQKQELLGKLSAPTSGAKQLTDEEKQKLLQSLSAPSKQ